MIVKLNKLDAQEIIEKYTNVVKSKDAERLKIISELLDDNGEVNLKVVIGAAYPNASNPINSINKSKSIIEKTAKENGFALAMKTDNAKLDNDKKLWFEGEDLIKKKVLDQIGKISQPDSDIENYATPQKRTIKYFVSYSHINKDLVTKFLSEFEDHIANRKDYKFVKWIDNDIIVGKGWDSEIQEALEECDFGLLLLSANYFTRGYIIKNELSHFIKKDKEGKVILLKSIFPIGLEKFDLNSDLLGLEQRQIFRLNAKSGLKFFSDLRKPHTINFVIESIKEIERKLKSEIEEEEKVICKTIETTPFDIVNKQKTDFEHYKTDKDIDNLAKKNNLSGTDARSGSKYKVHDLLDDWLHKEKKPLFAVLGQYGMGKTFTLQKYTIHQLKNLKDNSEDYYPFYFDLRKFEMKVLDKIGFTIWDIVDSILGRNRKADEKNPLTADDVKSIWNDERTLIIFDGLDEVLPHIADARKDSQFLNELFKLIPDFQSKIHKSETPNERKINQKMILSCRTDYFKSISAQYSFFQNQNREHIDGDKDFGSCTLLPFNKEQILKFLENTFPNKDRDKLYKILEDIHNLLELSSRPVFLDFIVEIFDKIDDLRSQNTVVTTANLYDLIIDKSFERDEGKHEITVGVKKLLLEEIAAFLWKRSSKRIKFSKLETFLSEILANGNAEMQKIWNNKESESLYKDLRNASFLTRSNESDFGFSHTSIQEYFLAKYIVKSIINQKWQNLELKNISNETIDFVMDLLQIMDVDDLELFNQSWKISFKNPQEDKNKLLLDIYIRDFKGNHLLIKPKPLDLSNMNFHNAKIHGKKDKYLDFSDAIFKNVNLRNSNLKYINFDRAKLNKADIRDSLLTDISMYQTKLKKTILSGTLRKVYAKDIELKDADIKHTTILKSTWKPKTKASNNANIIDTKQSKIDSFLQMISGIYSRINDESFSLDGKKVLSASDDKTMKYWDLENKKEIFSFDKHIGAVASCSFSPDDKKALSGSSDGTMKYWDLETKKEIFSFDKHKGVVWSCSFSPDGKKALSASGDGTMKYWDLETEKEIFSFNLHISWVKSCSFSPDGKRALSTSDDRTMKYWDLETKKEIFSFDKHKRAVNSCSFSPDGKKALSGSDDGTMKYWDLETEKEIFSFNLHMRSVWSCSFSPDGKKALSASDDGTMKYWDLETKKEIFSFDKHKDWVLSCLFSSDGKKALSASNDGMMKYWDLETKKEIFSFNKHKGTVWSGSFSPDGKKVLSASNDGEMKYWDLETKKEIFSFNKHKRAVNSCSFSPSGKKALSASNDGTMKYWDLETKKEIFSFNKHKDFVLSCSFSPDSKKALSASDDGIIKYWDLETKKEIFMFIKGEDFFFGF